MQRTWSNKNLRSLCMALMVGSILTPLASSTVYAAPPGVTQAKDGVMYATGRILVKGKPGLDDNKFLAILAKHGGKSDRKIDKIGVHIVKVPPGLEKKIVQELQSDVAVEFAELDQLVKADMIPNDPSFGSQWHHNIIRSSIAWDLSQGDGQTIAILDSGILKTHEDLTANLVPGWNSSDNTQNIDDVTGHGTKVAGTAAAITNNSIGISGIAGNSKIMPIRIVDTTGTAYYSTIASGVTYVADHTVRVANCSYGYLFKSASVQTAANYLKSKDGVLVVSAGNNGIDELSQDVSSMIVVSATDSVDNKASWSSYGAMVDVSAPGTGILTTTSGGGYGGASGTSFSAPMTAGLVAIIMGVNPQLSPDDVEKILKTSAIDLGAVGRDDLYGNGRIDAAAAVTMAKSYIPTVKDTTAPTTSITSPSSGSTVTGMVGVNANAIDNVGVVKVDLLINGALHSTDTAAPYDFVWDTTSLGNLPSITLTTMATDAAGNKSTSSGVTVKVTNIVDTTAPTVIISNPASGSKVSGTVNITSDASDNVQVQTIKLSIDGKLVKTITGSSLSYSWNTKKIKAGSHSLSTTAIDTSGNSSTAEITVIK